MKKNIIIYFMAGLLLTACKSSSTQEETTDDHADHHGHSETVHLSNHQVKSMNITIDSLPKKNLFSYVKANGQIEVPPQNEAEVTAIIGSNVNSIKVIEGDQVRKGQVLAYLSHPDIIKLQTEYINKWNELQFLEKEYKRQEKLYKEEVGSGKEYQKIQSEYNASIGHVKGLEAQLNLLGISISKLQENEISNSVAVRSPINGYVQMVNVKVGQYVNPSDPLFEVVNVEHVHADLMVFEKDAHKVKKGQKVIFTIQSIPDQELEAEIYAVGKTFEQDPKAVHLHAEINNKDGLIIPGMYVNGKILVDDVRSIAIPEEGLVREGNKHFIFSAKSSLHHGKKEWTFIPIEVYPGRRDDGWVEISLSHKLKKGALIALNNAYRLLAEMNKEEVEHHH